MENRPNPKRLCSEIQLFDLCAKEVCRLKDGKYCTDEIMLAKFESISEEEPSNDSYLDEDMDDADNEELLYDEEYDIGDYDEDDE